MQANDLGALFWGGRGGLKLVQGTLNFDTVCLSNKINNLKSYVLSVSISSFFRDTDFMSSGDARLDT